MSGALSNVSGGVIAPYSQPAAVRPAAVPPETPLATSTQPGSPNPSLHFDAAVGLVVLQFRDGVGGAITSIPTQQQLAAYQAGSASPPGGGTSA